MYNLRRSNKIKISEQFRASNFKFTELDFNLKLNCQFEFKFSSEFQISNSRNEIEERKQNSKLRRMDIGENSENSNWEFEKVSTSKISGEIGAWRKCIKIQE